MIKSIHSSTPTICGAIGQAAQVAYVGASLLINGIRKVGQLISKHPFIACAGMAALFVADLRYNVLAEHCSYSGDFYNQNPNGLPYFSEYSKELASRVQIPESELAQGWQLFGMGSSKAAYVHPSLPNHVVKVGCQDIMEEQFQNAEIAKEMIQTHNLDRITIPQSSKVADVAKPGITVSLDEKLEFGSSFDEMRTQTSYKPQKRAVLDKGAEQVEKLISEGYFCDINLESSRNARFLKDDTHIGLYDLDYRKTGIWKYVPCSWLVSYERIS